MARRRRQERFHEKHAWFLLFSLSLFIATTAVVGIVSGIDRTDFEQSANLTWDEMRALNPTVSDYVQRVIRLNGAAYLGLGLIAAVLSWTAYRRGERYAWFAMWVLPLALAVSAAVFAVESSYLAYYYGGYTLIAVVGLLLPYSKFFPKEVSE